MIPETNWFYMYACPACEMRWSLKYTVADDDPEPFEGRDTRCINCSTYAEPYDREETD